MSNFQRRIAADELRLGILKHLASLDMAFDQDIDGQRVVESLRSKSVWLDCDTGHDDALAILIAARSPDLRLLGISTVYGNAPLEKTTYNTRAVLQAIGRTDVPVYPGASGPLEREACFAPGIHGETGLDGTTCLPKPTVEAKTDMSAIDAMYRALSAQPAGTAWLVAVGTLTNVAKLFDKYPDLAEHISGLSVMGGCIGEGFTDAPLGTIQAGDGAQDRCGNWTPFAEFNIYCDPEAAQQIFSNPTLSRKATLIPLDLTHQFLATNRVQLGLLFGFDMQMHTEPTMNDVSAVRRLFFEILTFFAKTYAEMFGLTAGPPTHDPLAVAVALRPELFYCNGRGSADGLQNERFTIDIITEGEHGPAVENGRTASQCGRTVANGLVAGTDGVRIPRGLDSKALWALLEGCLSRTERSMGEDAMFERRDTGGALPSQHAVDTGSEDMASLVHGSNVTLSQFEMSTGLLPDIAAIDKEPGYGGHFLETNKEKQLGITPRNLNLTRAQQSRADEDEDEGKRTKRSRGL